jgi:hypothetical protein
MNKKILLTALFVAVTAFGASAQKLEKSSIDFLKKETQVNITFDFSVLKIESKTVEMMIAENGEKWKNWWEKAIPEFSEKFVRTLNTVLSDKNRDLTFGDFQQADYALTVKFLEINDDNDVKALLIFSQNDSENSLAEISIDGKAGRFGSVANLLGDAMKDAGRKFGKFLLKGK